MPWDDFPDFDTCLKWPTGGIFYDFPKKDGWFHGVVTDSAAGTGIVYVCPDESATDPDALPHYTKMWSWGNPAVFDREEAAQQNPPLAAGRPVTEYYEPWASAFNTAFFELYQFPPGRSSWEARFVPITEGLDNDKKQFELREVVDAAVQDALDSF